MTIHSINQQTSQPPPFLIANKCVALTITLLAISAIAIGTLALLATFPGIPIGLGCLSSIPTPASIALICFGALSIASLACCSIKRIPHPKESQPSNTPEQTTPIKADHSPAVQPSVILPPSQQRHLPASDYFSNLSKRNQQYGKELGITDINERLTSNYGPNPKQLSVLSTNNLSKVQFGLLCKTDEEILSLNCQDSWDLKASKIICFRLYSLYSKLPLSIDFPPGTIGAFCKLSGSEIAAIKNKKYYWPISDKQFKELCDYPEELTTYLGVMKTFGFSFEKPRVHALNESVFKLILHSDTPLFDLLSDAQISHDNFPAQKLSQHRGLAKNFLRISDQPECQRRIRLLHINSLKVFAPLLEAEQLALLSDAQFSHPEFPAAEIAKNPKQVELLFGLSFLQIAGTQRLLRLLHIDSVKVFAPFLSADHLRLLSDDHFKHPEFPAAEIAKDPKKVELLFGQGFFQIYKTERILNLLHIKSVKAFAPVLNGDLLRLLSDKQFSDPEFPAAEIAADPKKVGDLFAISFRTERILKHLHPNSLEVFMPLLTKEQQQLLRNKV